jgi:hypothetical protein
VEVEVEREAIASALWRTGFGTGCGPVITQTTK